MAQETSRIIGIIEKSQSRTGKHASYSNFFIVSKRGEVKQASPIKKKQVKPTYVKGNAEEAYFSPPITDDTVLVHIKFVKGLRGKVKGKIIVYDSHALPALIVNYSKLKIRRSRGKKEYSWAVKLLLDYLKIPVKRYNFNTGTEDMG